MPENAQANSNTAEVKKKPSGSLERNPLPQIAPVGLPISLRGIVIGGGIVLGVLLFVSVFAPNMSERIKFLTVNALSLFVLLAIGVQAYIYRRQWDVMERELKIAERAMQVSERTAQASEQIVKLSQQSFLTIERPYVLVGRAYLENPIISGKFPLVRLEFENTGKTPALNCRIALNMAFLSGQIKRMAEEGVMPITKVPSIVATSVIGASRIT